MCMLINRSDKPQLAETDITVYKVLDNSRGVLEPAYYHKSGLIYKLGELYSSKLSKIVYAHYEFKFIRYFDDQELMDWGFDIDTGVDNKFLKKNKMSAVDQGFHSALTKERIDLKLSDKRVVCECTIPKGSSYYTNISGLAVSNQIIINKIL